MNVSTPRSHSPLPCVAPKLNKPNVMFQVTPQDHIRDLHDAATRFEDRAKRAEAHAQRLADALKLHLANGGPLSDPVSRKQANGKAREALAQYNESSADADALEALDQLEQLEGGE